MSPTIDGNTGHPRRWAILSVLVVSLLVVVLDNTVLNVALRTIADPDAGLGATQGELEWSINSYTLVFAGLLFTAGVLSDRYGRRAVLLIGLAGFGLSSLVSSYAQTPEQLIWARAAMGIGAAAVLPATLSIISNVFDPRERGRAIGVWAGAVGLAVAIGPLVGGFLLAHFWWGSVFLINVPIAAIGVVLVLMLVPESRDPKPGKIDLVGVVLSIVGLVLLTYGVIDGGEHGFSRPQAWGTLVGGVLVLAGFVLYESRIQYPSLDVRLFANRRFSASVATVGLVFFALMGVMFTSVFYLQMVRDYSPLLAGSVMVPFAIAQTVFAPRSAAMVNRFGPKAVSTVGLLLVSVGLGGFMLIGTTTPLWVVGVLFFLIGVGMANVMPPATESIIATLPREKAGVGSAVGNTIRQVGGALGVAALGSLLSGVYRARLDESVPEAARSSITATYAAAEQGGAASAQLIAAANEAFLPAMHLAAAGSTIVALISVVIVFIFQPGRRDAGSAQYQQEHGTVAVDRRPVELVEA